MKTKTFWVTRDDTGKGIRTCIWSGKIKPTFSVGGYWSYRENTSQQAMTVCYRRFAIYTGIHLKRGEIKRVKMTFEEVKE